jgi:hypothetical protein
MSLARRERGTGGPSLIRPPGKMAAQKLAHN